MIISVSIPLSKGDVCPFHDLSQTPPFFIRLENQMNMVFHQEVMIELELVSPFVSLQYLNIPLVVGFVPEIIDDHFPWLECETHGCVGLFWPFLACPITIKTYLPCQGARTPVPFFLFSVSRFSLVWLKSFLRVRAERPGIGSLEGKSPCILGAFQGGVRWLP